MPTEMWQCDDCRAIYTTLDEAQLCEEEHEERPSRMMYDEIRERMDRSRKEIRMIKLTTKDGEPYWVNPALMTGMFPQDGGTRLCFIFPDDTVPVKEKPEEVNQAIEKHEFKEIRYKEKLDNLIRGYSGNKSAFLDGLSEAVRRGDL